jgi:uncharacterized protein (TIGR02996 family)
VLSPRTVTDRIARWRKLGLEVAFDPEDPPERVVGRAWLAEELAAIDAERLLAYYPRDEDGRLSLDEHVLLAAVDVTSPLARNKQAWLVARGPARRSVPQVVTLTFADEIARNARHRWDEARWLWDKRASGASELERWGVDGFPTEIVGRADAMEVLERRLSDNRGAASSGERAALAVMYARAGRWREALALYDVGHALDKLPYERFNAGQGTEPERWDEALAAWMREVAPWRFAWALDRADSRSREWRLFNFPGEKTSRKHCVMLRRLGGRPYLAVGYTASNARAPDVYWRWPPDLAAIVEGKRLRAVRPTDVAVVASGASSACLGEAELRAQIAAEPDLDDARTVLADLLVGRGDTRGEFIALQLREAAGALDPRSVRRMDELRRAEWRAWLGPLGALATSCRFERGFPVRISLGNETTPFDAWASAVSEHGYSELAAVRDLELADHFPAELAEQLVARLGRLQRLAIGVPLVGRRLGRVETLTIRVARERDYERALEQLPLGPAQAPHELRIAVTETSEARAIAGHIAQLAVTLPITVRRLAMAAFGSELAASRDARQDLSVFALETAQRTAWTTVAALVGVLAEAAVITSVSVTGRLSPNTQVQLRTACARFRIEPVFA